MSDKVSKSGVETRQPTSDGPGGAGDISDRQSERDCATVRMWNVFIYSVDTIILFNNNESHPVKGVN